MSPIPKPLKHDLDILLAMMADMEAYLRHDGLSYPLSPASYPRLTLCGYLLREHRLLAAACHVEDETWKVRLEATTARFRNLATTNVVRIETRLHEELGARIRQWHEYLRDVAENSEEYAVYYETAVTTRAMIAAAIEYLHMPPYKLNNDLPRQVAALDDWLHDRWIAGGFVWPSVWQVAYPARDYWWLHGRPDS